jgi:hypothetical protein
MQAFLEAKREEIAGLCRRHHVRRLAVFGSAVREDFDPARSDVDLLVEFEPEASANGIVDLRELEEEMVRLLGRDVDLIVAAMVENPFIRRRIRADRKLLYAA